MSLFDQIVESPEEWTGARVVDEVALAQYSGPDRRRGPGLPAWLRNVLVLCDFDTHLQMEGFLGWWENRALVDASLVVDALRSVGMQTDAQLLQAACDVLAESQLDSNLPLEPWAVSSFAERHPALSSKQYDSLQDIEGRLYLNEPDGPDLYAALVSHAASGLAVNWS